MKKLNLPDEIKTKIGTIKTDIHELQFQAGYHLAAGISFFYAAGLAKESMISTMFSMMGAGTLAITVEQIERIQKKKKEIEEYEQGNYIQGNITPEDKQTQLFMAKSNCKAYALETLLEVGLVGCASIGLMVNLSSCPVLALPPLILSGGMFSLDGYRTVRERKKVKQLEKSFTRKKSK